MTRTAPAFAPLDTLTRLAIDEPALRFKGGFPDGVRPSSVWQAVHAGLRICCWICVAKLTVGVGVGVVGLLLLEQPTATSTTETDNRPHLNLMNLCIGDTPCCCLTG